MYPVSEAFLRAVESNTRKYYWTGTITTKGGRIYEFDPEDIVKGSGTISSQCCGSTEIELGTVYASEMGITLFSDIDRYTMDGAEVRLYYHLYLEDGSVETVPMGIFEVTEANRNIKTLELKAYDYMLRFDRKLNLSELDLSLNSTPYQLLKQVCDICKVKMAQTEEEIAALPNGESRLITLTIFNMHSSLGLDYFPGVETCRDLLACVAQALACFCRIDREGRLVLKCYGDTVDWVVEQRHRYDSSYSEFTVRYTAISVNRERYAMETDNGLTMNLSENPLIPSVQSEYLDELFHSILTALQKVNYVPFDSSTIGNPAMEPGDIIRFTGGHADDTRLSCITSIVCRMNGKMSLKCAGKSLSLPAARSRTEKAVAGLSQSVESEKTVTTLFLNDTPAVIGETLTQVLSIDFTATAGTTVSFLCEMLLEVTAEEDSLPEMTVVYKVNDETVDDFMPAKTCVIGRHIVTLFFPISQVRENSANTFSMSLKISHGGITIGEGQIRAVISGQGLAAKLSLPETEEPEKPDIRPIVCSCCVYAAATLSAKAVFAKKEEN